VRAIGVRLVAALIATSSLIRVPLAGADNSTPATPSDLASTPTPALPTSAATTATVVALVDGHPITAAELDQGLQLQLYDLDVARYTARAARLRELVIERVIGPRAAAEHRSVAECIRAHASAADPSGEAFVAAQLAEAHLQILLAPPEVPRLVVSTDHAPVRGAADAPVTIVEFADFQCPNSRRLQPILRHVLDDYPGKVRLVMRNLPRPVHRDARLAAQAAACAGEQEAFWPYSDLLFQNQDALGGVALSQYAQRLRLDGARFADCLDSGRLAAVVDADRDQAIRLGVHATPTCFVNGRYLPNPHSAADLSAVIDAELARLATPPASVARTPDATPRTTPARPPDNTQTLSRAEVTRLLADRATLEQRLGRGELDVDGRRLLVVSGVVAGDLYERLGLRPGDVLMQVDGEWIDTQRNPLWNALRDRQRVSVTIIRRGLPQTFEYVIE
jgi:protein-disulfide isomerase